MDLADISLNELVNVSLKWTWLISNKTNW